MSIYLLYFMFLVIFYLRRSEISIFQYQPHSPRSKQTSYLCLGNIETCTVSDFVVFSFYMTKQISKESISRMKRVAWDGKREVPITISLVYWILIILLCLESEPGRGVRHKEPVAQHRAAWHQHQRWDRLWRHFICEDSRLYVSDVSRSARWGAEAASHDNTTRQPSPGKPR